MKNDETIDPRTAEEKAEARKREAIIRDNEERTRNEGLKKGVLVTAIIAFIVLLISGAIVYSIYNRDHKMLLGQMENQKNSLTERITSRDSAITVWLNSFDEIEKNIATIKEKEHIVSINSQSNELSKDRKQQVLNDITYINTLLQQNKQKIAALNSQLGKSGGTIKVLQNKITDLETSMKQSETDIASLKATLVTKNFEIEKLNVQTAVLNDSIVQKDVKITNQTNEMNKAFIATGTYKQLKAKGLLTKEGGFIGLGKTKTLVGSFSDNSFNQIDITVTKSIPVNSKNARLISEHPATSYQFLRDKDKKIQSIEITDPVQFWKISKYAVVELI